MDWREVFPIVQNRGPNQWLAKCPAHADTDASLSVLVRADRVLLKCFAGGGCAAAAICAAAGIKLSDLMLEPREAAKGGRVSQIQTVYSYRDEQGRELYQVLRMQPKEFRQRHRAGGQWVWTMAGVRRVPYRLPTICKNRTGPIIVCEGEKSADRLASLGLLSTCSSGGAGKWPFDFGQYFTGRRVAILPDNDEPGRLHAAQVAGSLISWGVHAVAIVDLAGVPAKGDVYDYLTAGGTRQQLIEAIRGSNWFYGPKAKGETDGEKQAPQRSG
jgi:putative DNA primase/helicase